MPGRPRFDLHVHTSISPDSRLPPEEAVTVAAALGLQGIAVTDHNRVAGVELARRAALDLPGFLVVPGVEISTADGHLLAYGISEVPPPKGPLLATIKTVQARGGLAVLAHPFRWAHGAGRRLAEQAPVDAIEALNGRNAVGVNDRATAVAAARRMATTGGSDAHDRDSLGRAVTEFEREVTTVEALLEEIRRGRVRPVGEGRTLGERVQISLENARKRTARGLRPV